MITRLLLACFTPLLPPGFHGAAEKIVRAGVPFTVARWSPAEGGAVQTQVGRTVRRIYLLGMTNSTERRSPLWPDPLSPGRQYFIGDELGRLRVRYADGAEDVFPLILGESLWWGGVYRENPEPFASAPARKAALAAALRLTPLDPAPDGRYVAAMATRPQPILSLALEDSAAKVGVPVLEAVTLADDATPAVPLLRRAGEDEAGAAARRETLRAALYSTEAGFPRSVPPSLPPGYAGPAVVFRGDAAAGVLANAFAWNLSDMAAKVGPDGMYHTSTAGAPNWGRYVGFGTYRKGLGRYFDQSWSRDLGRSLEELTELGDLPQARRCADYCLRLAPRWEEMSRFPRHWSRIINQPSFGQGPLENDGHGLILLFLYKLWQRLPDRDAWLRRRWPDLRAAADWIDWQFEHPDLTGATDVLHTTSECSAMNGASVYADDVCRRALLAFAVMAEAQGDAPAARRWRDRAARMRAAITARYLTAETPAGLTWTLASAGWPHQSTVLGPLMFGADFDGFAPDDGVPEWGQANAAAYRRLIGAYRPFGFYGQAMGYGQGFVTQAALLLDRMDDAGAMLEWMARQIYDPRDGFYIVPEGCVIDSARDQWYRIGDLGNGVQEAEIVKALRILIGVDDTRPERLQFLPRLPWGWAEMGVRDYPVQSAAGAARVHYRLTRAGRRLRLEIGADAELGPCRLRLGPFRERPAAAASRAERSGDSWWLEFSAPVGLQPLLLEGGS